MEGNLRVNPHLLIRGSFCGKTGGAAPPLQIISALTPNTLGVQVGQEPHETASMLLGENSSHPALLLPLIRTNPRYSSTLKA